MNIQPLFDDEEVINSLEMVKILENPASIEEFIPIMACFRRLKPFIDLSCSKLRKSEF